MLALLSHHEDFPNIILVVAAASAMVGRKQTQGENTEVIERDRWVGLLGLLGMDVIENRRGNPRTSVLPVLCSLCWSREPSYLALCVHIVFTIN